MMATGLTCQGSTRGAASFGAADRLRLAAAPTFAAMALLTNVPGGGPEDILCSTARHASVLSGMTPMSVLMSAFHVVPWLDLLLHRTGGAGRS